MTKDMTEMDSRYRNRGDLIINRLEVRQLQSVLALFELFHPDRC